MGVDFSRIPTDPLYACVSSLLKLINLYLSIRKLSDNR